MQRKFTSSRTSRSSQATFVSQIIYPDCSAPPVGCHIIGWNLDDFRCLISFYMSESEATVAELQLALALASKELSPNLRGCGSVPIILGEWIPRIAENTFIPESTKQNNSVWITLTSKSSTLDESFDSNSSQSTSSSNIINSNTPSLYSLFSFGNKYNTCCYMISYNEVDTNKMKSLSLGLGSLFHATPAQANAKKVSLINADADADAISSPTTPSPVSPSATGYIAIDVSTINIPTVHAPSYGGAVGGLSSVTAIYGIENDDDDDDNNNNNNNNNNSNKSSSSNSGSNNSSGNSRSGNSNTNNSFSQESSISEMEKIVSQINISKDINMLTRHYLSIIRGNVDVRLHVNSGLRYSLMFDKSKQGGCFPSSNITSPDTRGKISSRQSNGSLLNRIQNIRFSEKMLQLGYYSVKIQSKMISALQHQDIFFLSGPTFARWLGVFNPNLEFPGLTLCELSLSAVYLRDKLKRLNQLLYDCSDLCQSWNRSTAQYRTLLWRDLLSFIIFYFADTIFGVFFGSYIYYHKTSLLHLIQTYSNIIQNVWMIKALELLKENAIFLNLNPTITGKIVASISFVMNIFFNFFTAVDFVKLPLIVFVACIGSLGFTCQLMLIVDIFRLFTFHIAVVHRIMSMHQQFQIQLIISLYYLIMGTKRNILRNRIDSCEYDTLHFIFGMVVMLIVLFLFPSFAVFYYLFTIFQLGTVFFQSSIWTLAIYIKDFPYYVMYSFLIGKSELLQDGIVIVINNNNNYLNSNEILESKTQSLYANTGNDSTASLDKKLNSTITNSNVNLLGNSNVSVGFPDISGQYPPPDGVGLRSSNDTSTNTNSITNTNSSTNTNSNGSSGNTGLGLMKGLGLGAGRSLGMRKKSQNFGAGSTMSPKGNSMVYLHISPKPFEMLELFRGYSIYYKYFIEEKDLGWKLLYGIFTGRPALDIKLILAMNEVNFINAHKRRLRMAHGVREPALSLENKAFASDDQVGPGTLLPAFSSSLSSSPTGGSHARERARERDFAASSQISGRISGPHISYLGGAILDKQQQSSTARVDSIFIDENSYMQTVGYLQEITSSDSIISTVQNAMEEPHRINITFYEADLSAFSSHNESFEYMTGNSSDSLLNDAATNMNTSLLTSSDTFSRVGAIPGAIGSCSKEPSSLPSPFQKYELPKYRSYARKLVEAVPCKGLDGTVRRRISLLFNVVMVIFVLFCLLFSFAAISFLAFVSYSLSGFLHQNDSNIGGSSSIQGIPNPNFLRHSSVETFHTLPVQAS